MYETSKTLFEHVYSPMKHTHLSLSLYIVLVEIKQIDTRTNLVKWQLR